MSVLHEIFDKIYILSLPGSTRIKKTLGHLKEFGIHPEVFQATPGKSVSLNQPNKAIRWNNNAAGLSITTHNLLRLCISQGLSNVFIFEDDVELSTDFEQQLKKFLPNTIKINPNWELIHLGVQHLKTPVWFQREGNDRSNYKGVVRCKEAYYCHAYGINSTIFDYYSDLCLQLKMPIDLITSKVFHENAKSFAFHPNIAYQRPGQSYISENYEDHSILKVNITTPKLYEGE